MDQRVALASIKLGVDNFGVEVQRIKAQHANSHSFLVGIKELVQEYFHVHRALLVDSGIDVVGIDVLMQDLYKLTTARSATLRYKVIIKALKKQLSSVEIESLLLAGNIAVKNHDYTNIEKSILETLKRIAPGIAISYNQVLLDINDKTRISFRGSASEIREVLREVLGILAPDDDVEKMAGFKFEKDLNKPGKFLTSPTMKQKVRFILKSRGKQSGAMEAPENAVSIVEELVSNFTRSIYTRGSIATHTEDGVGRKELQRLKMYVDAVFCELLEIQL